jgi:hypothetical protein
MALSTMFTEAIKGVNGELSTGGDKLFQELLSQYLLLNDEEQPATESIFAIIEDVFTSILDYSSSAALTPILKIIIDSTKSLLVTIDQASDTQIEPSMNSDRTHHSFSKCVDLLLLAIYHRDGKSINNWSSLLNLLDFVIASVTEYQQYLLLAPSTLALLSASHQACPMDIAISHTRVFDMISMEPWSPYFLGFCEMYAELDHTRFSTFVEPYFKR